MKNTLTLITAILFMTFLGCENPDTTPPEISIASPVNGATVSDTITIKTLVADNESVKSVEFYLDGNLLAVVTNEPFETQWDTKESSNGNHTLQCKAIDESDNEALSEPIQITVHNLFFSASFTGDWFCPECGQGILFLSDLTGNVIFEETISGDEVIEIEPIEDGPSFSDRISVSTVYREWWNTDYVSIVTDYSVEPSSWTWKGFYVSTIGETTFEFQNIPDHSGYVVNPFWLYGRMSYTGTLSSPMDLALHRSPDDIYLKLNTDQYGASFKWIEGVRVGETNQIDLSDMQVAASKEINIPNPSGATGYFLNLIAYTNPNDRSQGSYYLDRVRDYDSLPDHVALNYPDGYFSDFRTRLILYENNDNNSGWRHYVFGDIPDQMELINADIGILNISSTSVVFSPSGTFDQTTSYWQFDDGSGTIFRWYFYGPSDLTTHHLPDLPQSFTDMFPGVSKESFQLVNVGVVDHSTLISYDEIIDLLFKSENRFRDVVNDSKHRYVSNPNFSGRSSHGYLSDFNAR